MARRARSSVEMDQRIGRNLRARRTSLSLTLDQVAVVGGISFQQVHKYERGANKISAEVLWRIARFLDAPLSSFYEDLEPTRPGLQPRF